MSIVMHRVNRQEFQGVHDLIASLKACSKLKNLNHGIRIHAEIIRRGLFNGNSHLGNSLIDMYAKCSTFEKARQVLDELPVRDVISWTALISGYTQHGYGMEALDCYHQMQREGLSPNAITLTCLLKACVIIGAVDQGEEIHHVILRGGFLNQSQILGTALIDMYAKCGALSKASQVFDKLSLCTIASWNALITGYAQHGHHQEALDCFDRLLSEGFAPDGVTFACILKVCGIIGAVDKGKQMHAEIIRGGFLLEDPLLGNALLDMYVKFGVLVIAQHLLDELPVRNAVTWNVLIVGYTEFGDCSKALHCFELMKRDGILPDAVTFACILKACGIIGAAQKGEEIHGEIVREGLLGKYGMLGTALVCMYAACGELTKAQHVFDDLPVRDIISWTALIAGYTQHGYGEQAVSCFEQMQSKGYGSNAVTFACILKACGIIGAADRGEEIHNKIIKEGLLDKDTVLASALVDMYATCGAFAKAQEVFDNLPVQDVVSWTALIAGYSQHGYNKEALGCFEIMQIRGLSPNAVTYTCLVDLFGRAGEFDMAMAMIKKIPTSLDLPLWFALLGACQTWGNANLGRLAFERAVHLDGKSAVAYVSMRNIYAAAGMEEDADKIEALRFKNEAWKKPACCTWTDLNGIVHSFCVGDGILVQNERLQVKLVEIAYKILQEGYCPNLYLVSQEVL